MPRKISFTLAALTLASLVSLRGQVPPKDSSDIKIGLVLSGGGAKALAQVGALKVIERAGIKLDYIGGTSMGAIVGALYSLGYSADEIEQHLRQVNWEALMANEIPRNRLSYFDRKYGNRYVLNLPFQNGKITLPSGLNYAQYILRELSFLTQQSYLYDNFRQFPVPFLCVATNLQTGKPRVFQDIRLIDALRASTAFPSLFTPYEINDSLYVDGGVVNNYPVQEIKAQGMDVIIGIDVQKFRRAKEELNTVVKVLEQTSTFVNVGEEKNQKKLTDIRIVPEIDEAGVATFNLLDTIIKAGEYAAEQQLPALKKLAARDRSNSDPRDSVRGTPLTKLLVDSIVVIGNEINTTNFVLAKFNVKTGDSCTLEKLQKGLDQLYGTQYFETVDYTVKPSGDGYTLYLNLKERKVLTTFRLGINYNDDFNTALLLNFTQRNLFFKNSRFSVDLALGENPRAQIDYFVDRGFIPTLGLQFRSNRFNFRDYNQFQASSQGIYQDLSLDLFIQSTLKDAYAIGGGVQFENIDISQVFDISGIPESNNSFINYYGYIDFDSFDDMYYPRKGFQLKARYRLIAERQGFEEFQEPSSVIDLHYNQVYRFGRRFTLISKFFGASTIGPDLVFPYKIHLGSLGPSYPNYIQPFIGYRLMEVTGRNALVARADLFFEFANKHYLIGRYNIGKLEPTFDDLFVSDILLDGYSLGYSFQSPLGPMEVNVIGSSNHDNIYTYVQLGYWF